MTERPVALPAWATNPPSGAASAPTPTEQTDGLPANEYLRRQPFNYLLGLIHQWLAYYSEREPLQDLLGDGLLPGGTELPDSGGLIQGAGHFTVSAVVGGVRIGPISGPARSYAVNTDTYWDLDEDAVITASVVASGGAAPALAAGSVRIGYVRTDGLAITASVDNRPGVPAIGTILRLLSQTSPDVPRVVTARDAELEALLANAYPGDDSGSDTEWVVLQGQGPQFAETGGFGIAVNARPETDADTSAVEWTQVDTGLSSFLVWLSPIGVTLYARAAGQSSPWAHSTASSPTWQKLGRWNFGGLLLDDGEFGWVDPPTRTIVVPAIAGTGSPLTSNWNVRADRAITTEASTQTFIIPLVLPEGAVLVGADVIWSIESGGTGRARVSYTGLDPYATTTETELFDSQDVVGSTAGILSLDLEGSLAARTVTTGRIYYASIQQVLGGAGDVEVRAVRVRILQNRLGL